MTNGEHRQIIESTKIRINFRKAKMCETCGSFDDEDNECNDYHFNVGSWNVCDNWRRS